MQIVQTRSEERCYHRTAKNMKYEVLSGDLLDQQVDVIVNAWNRNLFPWWLLLPQGVSRAIKRRAGLSPFRQLGKHGLIPLGEAVITTAGRLPHKAIIHVAGINLLWRGTEESISQSVINATRLAREHHFASIAFPVLGSGSGGFNSEAALAIMTDALISIDEPLSVRIVRFVEQN